jgi:hypothetical protein
MPDPPAPAVARGHRRAAKTVHGLDLNAPIDKLRGQIELLAVSIATRQAAEGDSRKDGAHGSC